MVLQAVASRTDPVAAPGTPPEVSIVSPTFNERPNIRPLVDAIARALPHVAWELVIVDDDSPDRTFDEVASLARDGWPVRCLRRVGRRGLASAVVEGALTSHAPFLAVMDADMQHDEALLPRMLQRLRDTDADLVIGSRYVEGGGTGDWSPVRRRLSRFATRISSLLIGSEIRDPMSGFFMIRHAAFEAALYNLSQAGYKILLDVMASSPTRLRVVELPYVFRERLAGESKLDTLVLAEYLFLFIEKLTGGFVPPRFVLFSLVGGIGLAVHLAVLAALKLSGADFLPAQEIATAVAMTLNFVVNNAVTYRSQRLVGWALIRGYVLFCLICSLGAVANIGIASFAIHDGGSWTVAGVAGAVMSAVFNFGVANQLVWRTRRPKRRMPARPAQT